MKKILVINCHPVYDVKEVTVVKLMNYTIDLLSQTTDFSIEVLNLYDENFYLPKIDREMLNAWRGGELSQEQKQIIERQNELVSQFVEADSVLIFSPLYNFNVVSKFKDYADNILIARRTFKYTAEGSIGLLDNSKKILYVQISGSEYDIDYKYVTLDFAPNYVRGIMNVMGISQMKLIRVEGMNVAGNDPVEIIHQAQKEIEQYVTQISK